MTESASPSTCPKCAAPLDSAGEGSCPHCLMLAAMQPTDGAERSPAPSLAEVSAAFPQLEILGLIGQGGMGCVFKARQPKLDRLVALKLLPASLAERDAAFAGRFEREGQLLARLHHPNIVAVHDSGKAGAFFYLLMEYVDGVNLREAMRASRFTAAQALGIVPRICEALQFAHDEGVLHRDIKPENILLDAKGRVKLADFGIAKLIGDPTDPFDPTDQSAAPNLTQSGTALGTPSYMAPEQRDTPADVDHRADIYSLGVVFYELLTGELPAGSLPRPSTKSDADPRVDAIVQQALEKERGRRQRSAGEMKTQVEAMSTPPPLGQQLPRGAAPVPLSQRAVVSAIIAGLALPTMTVLLILSIVSPLIGTLFTILNVVFLPIALVGVSLGYRALRAIRKQPSALRGIKLATFGTVTAPLFVVNIVAVQILHTVFAAVLPHNLPGWLFSIVAAIAMLVPVDIGIVRRTLAWARGGVFWGEGAARWKYPALAALVVPLLLAVALSFGIIQSCRERAKPIPPGTLWSTVSTTEPLRDGKWKRTWRIRAGGDMIWQAVGMPQLLPISRMGQRHPNEPNYEMNVDLALADIGDGKVRITQSINGHSASVDAAAKIEELIREAGPNVAKPGRVQRLANLSVAPLVLARIDDETMLPNGVIGIADPVPRPASNLYLHIWQTAPSPGRLVLTRQIFPNVASEDIQENELLGRLEARRGSDGKLTYNARFHSLGNQVGSYEGPLELDRPVIYETRTDHRCGYAVLTTNPVADQQLFPPIERWRYFAKHLTPARIEAWKNPPLRQGQPRADDVVFGQDERGAVTVTGPLEKVRHVATQLRLLDQPEVKDPTQLPHLNMPPEFFIRTALPMLMFPNDFAKVPLTDALREALQKESITPAQLSRALAGHVIEVEKTVFKDSGPPLDSIKHTPGASTFYDVTIPCLDLYDGSGFPTKELTLRIERTVQEAGTQSKIAGIAPWLIAEAKKLPATTLLEK